MIAQKLSIWCISPLPSPPRSTHLDKKRYHRHHTKNKEIAVRVHVKLPFCRLSLAEYEIYTSFLAVAKYLCARKKKEKRTKYTFGTKPLFFPVFYGVAVCSRAATGQTPPPSWEGGESPRLVPRFLPRHGRRGVGGLFPPRRGNAAFLMGPVPPDIPHSLT